MNNILPIGHNNPPSDLDIVKSRLDAAEKSLREGIDEINKAPIPAVITDAKTAGAETDRIKNLKGIKKSVEDCHKSIKAPYLECGKAVDGWKNYMAAEVDSLIAVASIPLSKYLEEQENKERERQLELARLEREKAEALALEAQKHQEAGIGGTATELLDAAIQSESLANRIDGSIDSAKSSDLAKSRSASGATSSRKTKWVGEIISIEGIDLNTLRYYFGKDAIQAALDSFVRQGGRECAGAVISEKVVGLNIR